MGKQKA